MTAVDVAILGAGIAGASLAAELAPRMRVALLEVEDLPGRHATGRSAAMVFESYGNATIRALTRASRPFLDAPPGGFCATPLLRPRPCVYAAGDDRIAALDAIAGRDDGGDLEWIGRSGLARLAPMLRSESAAAGLLDRSGAEIDVDALLQAYLRAARVAGATLSTGLVEVETRRLAGTWRVAGRGVEVDAGVIVIATGAWADQVAAGAGARLVGLRALRRTMLTLAAPAGIEIEDWPMVLDADEEFYLRPDAGRILLSPANEDEDSPGDAAPDELDVAIAMDRLDRATTLGDARVVSRWAGLRCFAPDRTPVVGFDPEVDGLFWFAGQGGYGIQVAPALARLGAGLLSADAGTDCSLRSALAPGRFRH